MSDGTGKPMSGAAKRKAKKARDVAARAAAIAARATGDGILDAPPPCSDPSKAHLWCIENLTREIEDCYRDPTLDPPSRRRQVAELTRAVGMLSVKGEMERRVAELETKLNTALDELARRRAELEQRDRTGR